jgi:hypothetical protein
MPTTVTNPKPYPNVPLPPGFDAGHQWEPGRYIDHDETRAWRTLDGVRRTITDNAGYVHLSAIQYSDGSLEDLEIFVFTDDDNLNSDQARELAAALLEAAAELDRLVAR